MTFGKRQLVVAALVVALGAAVYLNWQFSDTDSLVVTDTEAETTSQLGQTTYVNTEVSASSKTSDTSQDSDEASDTASSDSSQTDSSESVLSDEEQDCFEAARESRSEAHDEAQKVLEDIISSFDSTESEKNEAVEAAEELALLIKAESDIETAIKAKGFEECVVLINNGSCSVIVSGGTLDDAAVVTISQIVNSQADIDYDNITISEVS